MNQTQLNKSKINHLVAIASIAIVLSVGALVIALQPLQMAHAMKRVEAAFNPQNASYFTRGQPHDVQTDSPQIVFVGFGRNI